MNLNHAIVGASTTLVILSGITLFALTIYCTTADRDCGNRFAERRVDMFIAALLCLVGVSLSAGFAG